MSSPDHNTPYFDGPYPEAAPEDDIFPSTSPRSKKPAKKKGKKGKKYVDPYAGRDAEVEAEAETEYYRPWAQLKVPSPRQAQLDEFHGVDLHEDDFPPDQEVMDEPLSSSPQPLIDIDDELPSLSDPDPSENPFPFASPTTKSPPLAPIAASNSPVIREKTPYASPPPIARETSPYASPPRNEGGHTSQRKTSSASASQPRRDFFPTRTSSRSQFVEPAAAPHKPQPHFYGLPDLNLNFGSKKTDSDGKTAGSDKYCCTFDSFANSGDETSAKKAKDALLVGSEGGLEVFRVLPNKLEVVGRLEGLRGSVIGAKILPHTEVFDDMQPVRPLVAVIVHGVMIEETATRGRRGTFNKESGLGELKRFYQTSVEVYSLQTQQHVATLYKTLPVVVEQPTIGQSSFLPEPIGDLSITAQGKFVLLASGKSGEIFVFTNASITSNAEGSFRCIGKYWTSLQHPLDMQSSRPLGTTEPSQAHDDGIERVRTPLFSLSQRWLALVPPSTSAHVSIQGWPILSEHNPTPAGIASAVAPPQPLITCDIAGVDSEDTWSRLTRQAARGVVKYSQKGIDLGWQGWKELTNPTPQHVGKTSNKENEDLFPPTNAPPDDPRRTKDEPAIVSIFDLAALLADEETKPKYPALPLTTFPLRDGCNFLSFSSTGLRLVTASRKGDISTVWDLTHSFYGGQTHNSPTGPFVKQVHCISRNSPSVVIDCAWSRDDEYLALLTTHGTVHLHNMPAHSSSRKRKRRGTNVAPAPGKAQPIVSVSHESSPPSSSGGFMGSIMSGWQQVSSQVASLGNPTSPSGFGIPTTFAGFKEATASAGHASGRVLAKGLSQSLSVAKGGASDYWHADDNKIRHKALQDHVYPGSLRWMKRQSDVFLAVVCGGTVHLHPIQRVERRKGDVLVSGLKSDKYGQKHFALPPIRTRTNRDASNGLPYSKKAREDQACAQQGPHGFWSLRPAPTTSNFAGHATGSRPPQPNEVESNPPYCPFHIDPRVDIFALDQNVMNSIELTAHDSSTFHTRGHGTDLDSPGWTFGEPLPPGIKMNTHEDLNDLRGDFGADSDIDIDLAEQMESTLTVRTGAGEDGRDEIRINTRRSQGRADPDDGEFEVLEDDNDDGSGSGG